MTVLARGASTIEDRVRERLAFRTPYLRKFTNDPRCLPVWCGFTRNVEIMGLQGNEIVVGHRYADPEAWLALASRGGDAQFLGWFSPYDFVEVIVDHELGHWVYRRLPDAARREWVATKRVSLGDVTLETKPRTEEEFAWFFMFWLGSLGHLLSPLNLRFFQEHVPA